MLLKVNNSADRSPILLSVIALFCCLSHVVSRGWIDCTTIVTKSSNWFFFFFFESWVLKHEIGNKKTLLFSCKKSRVRFTGVLFLLKNYSIQLMVCKVYRKKKDYIKILFCKWQVTPKKVVVLQNDQIITRFVSYSW